MTVQRAAQLLEAGLWLQMSGDVEGARRLFEQALKLDPTNARARELLAAPTPSAPQPPPAAQTRHTPPDPFQRPDDMGEVVELTHPSPPRSEKPLPPEPVVQPIELASDATSAWDSQSNPGVKISSVKPGLGDVMDMIAREKSSNGARPAKSKGREELETLLRGARDLLELDDHTGAMDLILKAQAISPNDPEVQQLRTRSEKTLQAMFESKLGPLNARPTVMLKQDEIIWLNLDHRAGFVLAQIDGSVSFEDLFEVCGMSRLDTARILAQLVDEGVITV